MTHVHPKLTKKQRANLRKLADYLTDLPKGYEHFDMRDYANSPSGGSIQSVGKNVTACGTVACAVGHGPAAGIRVWIDDDWRSYGKRVFGVANFSRDKVSDTAFDFMFGSGWDLFDNTPHGAAARIRYFLANGAPVKLVKPAWLTHPIYYYKEG